MIDIASIEQALAMTMQISIIVFSVVSMLGMGLASPLRELIEPLRRAHSVTVALIANFVIVPAIGFAIVDTLSLQRSVEVGLLLVATAAGAPFLVKLTTTAQGDVALSATLLVLLLPATILYMPLVLPFVVPEASVSAWEIARPLLLMMLLPLAIGMFVRALSHPGPAILPWLRRLTTAALVILVASALASNVRGIRSLIGTGALAASALLIAGAFLAGYVLSTRGPDGRVVLGLGTAQRNIAAATVVATQGLGDPTATLTVIVTSLIGLGILFPLAWWLRRKMEGRETKWQRRSGRTS